MNTNIEEVNEDELLKEAVKIIFDKEKKESTIPDWDKALIDLLEEQDLPIICLIHFRFSEVVFEELIETRHGFEHFSTNLLNQLKKFRFERRKEMIKSILESDNELNLDGFWSYLALEFWSKMCKINQEKLKLALPKDFTLGESRGPKVGQIITKKTKSKKISDMLCGPIKSLIDFVLGSYVQITPPRRVVSIEEQFRVISFEKLLFPQSDNKEKEKNLTLRQKIKNFLLKLYKIGIYSVGGNWPKPYQPTQEEILNDILVWALDVEKAQERILAFSKDMIKREIIS